MAATGTDTGAGHAFFPRADFMSNQSIEILGRFDSINALEHHCYFGSHFLSDNFVVFVRELAALVLEIEILNVAQNDILFSLKQIPLGFLKNRGIERIGFREEGPADRGENASTEQSRK